MAHSSLAPSIPNNVMPGRLHRWAQFPHATTTWSVQSLRSCLSDCSRPYCSHVRRMDVRSGRQHLQLLVHCKSCGRCNKPFCHGHADLVELFRQMSSFRNCSWCVGMIWRRLLQFWTAMATVAPSSIRSHVFRDSLPLASQGCPHTWTAQVYACLEQHGVRIPVATGAQLQLPLLSLNWQFFASGNRPCMLCLLNPAQHTLLGPCSAHSMGSSHGLTVGRL